MGDTISIKEVFRILLKRWLLIFLISLFTIISIGCVSLFLITPKYEASSQILVTPKDGSNQIDISQIISNIDLINTYSVIIKSPAILGKVKEELDLSQNIGDLTENIFVNSESESQVFSLTVRNENPEVAILLVNTIAETFEREIKVIMNVDNVSILSKAELAEEPSPVSPKPILNIAVGFIVGPMLGIGMAFLREVLDNSLKSSEDVEFYLELPVLGTVKKIPKQQLNKMMSKQRTEVKNLETQIER